MKNEKMEKAMHRMVIALIIIMISQFGGIFLGLLCIKKIIMGVDSQNYAGSLNMVFGVIIFICIIGDVWFFKKRVLGLKELLFATPIKCVVEDIVVFRYKRGSETEFDPYMLVRNPENDKLYFTYGKYSLSYYKSKYVKNANTLVNYCFVREDNSAVELGDEVKVYIRRPVSVKVQVKKNEPTNKRIILNNDKYKYTNINHNYDANTFLRVNFFEGVIDIEY